MRQAARFPCLSKRGFFRWRSSSAPDPLLEEELMATADQKTPTVLCCCEVPLPAGYEHIMCRRLAEMKQKYMRANETFASPSMFFRSCRMITKNRIAELQVHAHACTAPLRKISFKYSNIQTISSVTRSFIPMTVLFLIRLIHNSTFIFFRCQNV